MHGPVESAVLPTNSLRTGEIDEKPSNSRTTATYGETYEGLDRAVAITFRNLLWEKKPIDWCEAQSRGPTARVAIKLIRVRPQREDIPTEKLKNQSTNPDEV